VGDEYTVIVSDSVEHFINSIGRNCSKRVIICRCDQCDATFQGQKRSFVLKHHFCCRSCWLKAKQPGGLVDLLTKETLVKKYGVDNIMKLPENVKRSQETNIKKYGARYASMTDQIKHKAAKTCLKKYGCVSPMQNDDVLNRSRLTLMHNFGVTVPLRNPSIKNKWHETNKVKYGATTPFQSRAVIETRVSNMLQMHGVRNAFSLPHVKARANSPDACARRHETIKKNGRMRSSKAEDRVYCILSERAIDVKRWIWHLGFSNDIYIPVYQTYVQVDGVYWHGLDRSLNEIDASAQLGSERDALIAAKHRRDIAQNSLYAELGIKLVRVTDKQVDKMNDDEIYAAVADAIRSIDYVSTL